MAAMDGMRHRRLGKARPPRGPSFDSETPAPGHYLIQLRRDGPPVALRIWLGPPIDPATGAEVPERGVRWQCQLNGAELVPLEDYWPGCARKPITKAEHDRIAALSRTMDPAHPFYDPRRRINRLTAPMPF